MLSTTDSESVYQRFWNYVPRFIQHSALDETGKENQVIDSYLMNITTYISYECYAKPNQSEADICYFNHPLVRHIGIEGHLISANGYIHVKTNNNQTVPAEYLNEDARVEGEGLQSRTYKFVNWISLYKDSGRNDHCTMRTTDEVGDCCGYDCNVKYGTLVDEVTMILSRYDLTTEITYVCPNAAPPNYAWLKKVQVSYNSARTDKCADSNNWCGGDGGGDGTYGGTLLDVGWIYQSTHCHYGPNVYCTDNCNCVGGYPAYKTYNNPGGVTNKDKCTSGRLGCVVGWSTAAADNPIIGYWCLDWNHHLL
jgi:hypothetical protein